MRILHKRPRFWWATCLALTSASAVAAGGGVAEKDKRQGLWAARMGDLSVLTYNVKGLPWPIASDRSTALGMIGDQLASMRRAGRQPDVVVLQEAFTDEAKAIGQIGGYRYQVRGVGPGDVPSTEAERPERHWYLGETQGKKIDSGLVILSDYPIVRSKRIAFAETDCAGFDCLAAKGALLAEVALPSGRKVVVATTHLNSRSASRADPSEADAAYARQTRSLGRFVEAESRTGDPVIVAGDFNRGNLSTRGKSLRDALTFANGGTEVSNQLDMCLRSSRCRMHDRAFAREIVERARDFQFVLQDDRLPISVVAGSVPFPEHGGLSDHAGYVVSYRIDGPR